MNLFKKKDNKDYTVIIGCGRLGANIANSLSNSGDNVLIIDERADSFKKLSSSFGGLSILGDGTDYDVLKEANLGKASTVIVVTNDDNINIMIAQIARDVYKVNKVIARLYDVEREAVYQEFGINTICPAILSVNEIDKLIS